MIQSCMRNDCSYTKSLLVCLPSSLQMEQAQSILYLLCPHSCSGCTDPHGVLRRNQRQGRFHHHGEFEYNDFGNDSWHTECKSGNSQFWECLGWIH